MELEQDLKTIKQFLKYLPRHLKSKSLPRLDQENKTKKGKNDENLSRNELKDRLKQKILQLRQRTKKKVREAPEGTVINKRIRKEKPQKQERSNSRAEKIQKAEKVERGRDQMKGAKSNGKPKAKSQKAKVSKNKLIE